MGEAVLSGGGALSGLMSPKGQGGSRRAARAAAKQPSSIRFKLVPIVDQELEEFRMNVELLATDLLLSQHAGANELGEVAGCRLARANACSHEVADAAIRLLKDDLDKLAAVDFR